MKDIKPDTSLYTDLPNKLRALALILESDAPREFLQESEGSWRKSLNKPEECLDDLTRCGHEYRIKPGPRELWKLAVGSNYFRTDYPTRELAEAALSTMSDLYTVVRFVEQP